MKAGLKGVPNPPKKSWATVVKQIATKYNLNWKQAKDKWKQMGKPNPLNSKTQQPQQPPKASHPPETPEQWKTAVDKNIDYIDTTEGKYDFISHLLYNVKDDWKKEYLKKKEMEVFETQRKPITKTINGNEWVFYGKFGFNKSFYDAFKFMYSYGRTSAKAYQKDLELRKQFLSQQIGKDFYPTPEILVNKIMGYIKDNKQIFGVNTDKYTQEMDKIHLLEPSAGTGSMIKGFIENFGFDTQTITANEYESDVILKDNLKGVQVIKGDFMSMKKGNYDLIIMNPPFNTPNEKQIYFDHFFNAMRLCNRYGHIILVCPPFHDKTNKDGYIRELLGESKQIPFTIWERMAKKMPDLITIEKDGKNKYPVVDRTYQINLIGTSKGDFYKLEGGKPSKMGLTVGIYDIEVI